MTKSYAKSKESARKILFHASRELFKINLNINSSKVKEFQTKAEFEQYWAFEIFEQLADKDNQTRIQIGVQLYFQNIDNKVKFREGSVLKRILTVNFDQITPEYRHRLFSGFYPAMRFPN